MLLGALAWAVDAVFVHRSFVMDNRCQQRALSCGILASFLVPVLTLALVSAFFLLGRLWYLRRRYLGAARTRPQDVVPTAGNIIGDVVGRDELCRVMIADLRAMYYSCCFSVCDRAAAQRGWWLEARWLHAVTSFRPSRVRWRGLAGGRRSGASGRGPGGVCAMRTSGGRRRGGRGR